MGAFGFLALSRKIWKRFQKNLERNSVSNSASNRKSFIYIDWYIEIGLAEAMPYRNLSDAAQ